MEPDAATAKLKQCVSQGTRCEYAVVVAESIGDRSGNTAGGGSSSSSIHDDGARGGKNMNAT